MTTAREPPSCERVFVSDRAAGFAERASFIQPRLSRVVDAASTTLGNEDRNPLIQGGPLAPLFSGTNTPIPHIDLLETIDSTDHTGLTHRRGTVSLARDLLTTGHILPELFICLDDYPELDAGGRSEPDEQGFPAFGTVASGLDVVTAIAQRERHGASPIELLTGEILTAPVTIVSATISEPTTEGST